MSTGFVDPTRLWQRHARATPAKVRPFLYFAHGFSGRACQMGQWVRVTPPCSGALSHPGGHGSKHLGTLEHLPWNSSCMPYPENVWVHELGGSYKRSIAKKLIHTRALLGKTHSHGTYKKPVWRNGSPGFFSHRCMS